MTKAEIREEARRIFLADGMRGLSMRKLAKGLGVTATSLYWHYANKEELVADVFVDGAEVFSQYLVAALEGADSGERLRRTSEAFLRFGLERPRHFELFFLHRPEGIEESFVEPFAARRRATFQFLVDRIRENLDEGRLKPVASAAELSLILMSTAQGLVGLHLNGQLDQADEEFRKTYRRALGVLLDSWAAPSDQS
ncbi:MAG: TetR/AcrR family transcriptional regulator [Myxococcota bacterium]